MVKKFIDEEQAYFAGLAAQPIGYVLKAHKNPRPGYLALHRTTCRSISVKQPAFAEGGFTERDFLKVIADTEQGLRDWLRQEYDWFRDFSHVCGQCLKGH